MHSHVFVMTLLASLATTLIAIVISQRDRLPHLLRLPFQLHLPPLKQLKQLFVSLDGLFIILPAILICLYVFHYEQLDILSLLRKHILLFFGFIVSMEDIKHKRIPNGFIGSMAVVWLMFVMPQLFIDTAAGVAYLSTSGLGFLIGGGLFLLVYIISKHGLGGGDVKFMAVAGLYLGFNGVLPAMLYGSVLSAVVGGTLILFKRIARKDAIPLAPFLYIGILITIFTM